MILLAVPRLKWRLIQFFKSRSMRHFHFIYVYKPYKPRFDLYEEKAKALQLLKSYMLSGTTTHPAATLGRASGDGHSATDSTGTDCDKGLAQRVWKKLQDRDTCWACLGQIHKILPPMCGPRSINSLYLDCAWLGMLFACFSTFPCPPRCV